jgi:hypothetical protein
MLFELLAVPVLLSWLVFPVVMLIVVRHSALPAHTRRLAVAADVLLSIFQLIVLGPTVQ